jgi:serine/threonine-protein kinase
MNQHEPEPKSTRRTMRYGRSWLERETVEIPPQDPERDPPVRAPGLRLPSRESARPRRSRVPLTRAGAYAIEGELGRGGMGLVYRARHDDGTAVALKVLRGGLHAHPDDVARFRLEARLSASLEHRHLLRVHDHGQTACGHWFIAMELIEGTDLHSLIEADGPLEPRQAARLGLALAEAVGAVHAAGALHRDLKPHNVLIDGEGTPYLIDFGLAKDRRRRGVTRRGTVLGTPAYMAPEQASGWGKVDERADVYGLGATLFHMLSGEPPYDPFRMEALLRAQREDPSLPSLIGADVDPLLEAVVVRALAKTRSERFRCAGALATALREWLHLHLGQAPGSSRLGG